MWVKHQATYITVGSIDCVQCVHHLGIFLPGKGRVPETGTGRVLETGTKRLLETGTVIGFMRGDLWTLLGGLQGRRTISSRVPATGIHCRVYFGNVKVSAMYWPMVQCCAVVVSYLLTGVSGYLQSKTRSRSNPGIYWTSRLDNIIFLNPPRALFPQNFALKKIFCTFWYPSKNLLSYICPEPESP